MATFVNRKDELATLEREFQREEASLVIVYGRRRVGKTSLLNEFAQKKRHLYYLASEESEKQNLVVFKDAVATFTQNTLLRDAVVERWESVFQVLSEADSKERMILIIDEFQYLGKANKAFPSILQRIWDTLLKNKNIMLVLCGSFISMMLSQTLSYNSPLYGRRTAQLRLRQIPFKHYGEFFGGKSETALIELYGVTGGVPKYIEVFKSGGDIYSAIRRNVLDRSGFLYEEAQFLLQSEVHEVGSYFSIMRSIAAGNRKLSSISGSLGIKQTDISNYLKTLIELDLVEREVPVTVKNPEKSKKGLYRITDNYFHFWFRFVYPNKGLIESGNVEHVVDRIRTSFIDGHVAYVYEDICRASISALSESGQLDAVYTRVGRWWDKSCEIDIVAIGENEEDILFGECKYRKKKIGTDVLRSLEEKVAYFMKVEGDCRPKFVLFSVGGFSDELIRLAEQRHDLVLHD